MLPAYLALVLAIVVGLVLLSPAVGESVRLGRIVWLGVGVLLGGLWALRSRLPVLNASSTRIAASGWLGLILASVVTVAIVPADVSYRTLASRTLGAAPGTATPQSQQGPLRPAPPTAARRTGTVEPSPEAVAVAEQPGLSPTAGEPPVYTPGPDQPVALVGPSPSPVPARAVAAATPALPAGFDPQKYLGQGNAFDCADLASQAEAQAILRADPTDPNVIDNDRDGIACESNPPPRDTRRVARPAR
jgi:hypothetical protein